MTRQELKSLYLEWVEDMQKPKSDALGFYIWANDVIGPIVPPNRNDNAFKWVKDEISRL